MGIVSFNFYCTETLALGHGNFLETRGAIYMASAAGRQRQRQRQLVPCFFLNRGSACPEKGRQIYRCLTWRSHASTRRPRARLFARWESGNELRRGSTNEHAFRASVRSTVGAGHAWDLGVTARRRFRRGDGMQSKARRHYLCLPRCLLVGGGVPSC